MVCVLLVILHPTQKFQIYMTSKYMCHQPENEFNVSQIWSKLNLTNHYQLPIVTLNGNEGFGIVHECIWTQLCSFKFVKKLETDENDIGSLCRANFLNVPIFQS